MALPIVPDKEFIALFKKLKSPSKVAAHLGVEVRAVHARRRRLEILHSVSMPTKTQSFASIGQEVQRKVLRNIDGKVIVFSDVHAWPSDNTPAYRALLYLIKKLEPKVIVCNGDLFDGATISRFAQTGIFDFNIPSVLEELEYCKLIMNEIENAAPKNCNLIYTIGNHDIRFSSRLANCASEFKGIKGFRLRDYFPNWSWSWSCVINPNTSAETWIKHRYHNSAISAAYQNVLKSGSVHIVTAHTHALEVKPLCNIRGERKYGVQTGTLSPVNNTDKFSYAEDNPTQASQGFIVLTYKNNLLLPPEIVENINGTMYYQNEAIPDGNIPKKTGNIRKKGL